MVWWILIFLIAGLIVLWMRVSSLSREISRLNQLNDRVYAMVARLRRDLEAIKPSAAASLSDVDLPAERRPAPVESTLEFEDFPTPVEAPAPEITLEEPAEIAPAPEHRPSWMPPPMPERARAEEQRRVAVRPAAAPTAAYERAPVESRPDVWEKLGARLKQLGPDDPNMSFEMALGTYWLPRAGIVFLSIGVVFLLALAAQRWGAPLRVGIGYAVAVGLLVGAWRLDRKYPPYARVLYAGGFALTYFVTFATYYVPYAKIFETPYPTLAALVAIVIAWGVVAQQRRSPTIAVLVTFLGHLTVGVATFSVDDPAVITATGILLLSAGSAYFLLRDRWYYVAALGMFGSYLNHFLLLGRSDSTGTVGEFIVVLGVLTLYFFIFALAELFAPERLRRDAVPTWVRTTFVTFNTAAYLAIGTLIVAAYDFSENEHHLFRYALAIVLLGFALAYLLRRERDPLYNTYMTKAAAVLTLGLAYQFSGASLTALLAVEMVVLLVSARQSGLVVARLLALTLALVALGHGFYTAAEMTTLQYGDTFYVPRLIQAALAVLAFWVAAVLYQRMNWAEHAPKTLPLPRNARVLLWQLDFIRELPEGETARWKPASGLLIPFTLALAGAALFTALAPRLFPALDGALVAAAVALALAIAARVLLSPPLGYAGIVLAFVAMVWNLLRIPDMTPIPYDAVNYAEIATKTLVISGLILGISEFVRRLLKTPRDTALFPMFGSIDLASLQWRREEDQRAAQFELELPILLAVGATALLIANAFILLEMDHRLLGFATGAVLLSLIAAALSAAPIGLAALLLLPPAYVVGTVEAGRGLDTAVAVAALALLFVVALLSEPRWAGRSPGWTLHRLEAMPYVMYSGFAWLLALFLTSNYAATTAAYSIAAAAVVAALCIHMLNRGAMAFIALALFVWAQLLWHVHTDIAGTTATVMGVVLIALAVAAERYYAHNGFVLYRPIWATLAWIMALHFAATELDDAWHATGWAIVALAFLGYTLLVRLRTTGALAIAAGLLASAYQLLITYGDQPPDLAPLLAGYLLPVAFWLLCERLLAAVAERVQVPIAGETRGVFVAVVTFLLVLMLERTPQLAEYYLTVSWSLLGMALFGLALAFHSRYYRYAGLAVLLLAALRVVLVDTRELDPMPRVAAWAVLGAVLLLLGLGYVKAVARNQPKPPPREETPEAK